MNKRYTLAIEVRIPSVHEAIIQPVKADLNAAGWTEVSDKRGVIHTWVTYEVEITADRVPNAPERVRHLQGAPEGVRSGSGRIGDRIGPKRESRRRKSSARG